MHKFFLRHLKFLFVILSLVFIPKVVSAANLTFKVIPNASIEDKTQIVEVHIDPQSKKLNVVEGTIKFSGESSNDLSVQIENGESLLPIWPTPPQYDKGSKSINFTGGVPDGFDSEGLLFKLLVTPQVNGNLIISYLNGNVYLNDGMGTKDFISSKEVTISFDKVVDKNIKSNYYLSNNKYIYVIITLLILTVLIFIFKHDSKKN